jgi:hypothetical protein
MHPEEKDTTVNLIIEISDDNSSLCYFLFPFWKINMDAIILNKNGPDIRINNRVYNIYILHIIIK